MARASRSVRARAGTVAAVLGVLLAGAPVVADEEPAAQDYTAIEGLSQPEYATRVDEERVVMRDGVEIAAVVTRPDAEGRWPAILVLSPYHHTIADLSGDGFLGPDADGEPVGLAGYFAPRGYAVVHADLRGTGRSTGCLEQLGPEDRADGYELLEWVAAQPWSNGRVGMAGHSYPGFAALHTASLAPPHLVTVLVNAAGADWYSSHYFQGVPYQPVVHGPLATYPVIAAWGYAQEPASRRPTDAGCEWGSSSAGHADHVSSTLNDWWRERDAREGVAAAEVPVFAAFGADDPAVTMRAMDWFTARGGREGDKLWVGQWAHGTLPLEPVAEGYPYPNDREEQWRAAVHAWFDRHLQERDVVTGPPVEVFLNDGRVLVERAWPLEEPGALTLYPRDFADPTGALSAEPGPAEVASFTPQPPGLLGACVLGFCTPPGVGSDPERLRFDSDPVDEAVLLLGAPALRLRAAIDGPRVNLLAQLYDVAPNGTQRRIHVGGFAINPELRDGLGQAEPVVPGEVMDLDVTGTALAHRLLPGHRLRLYVSTTDGRSPPAGSYPPLFGHGATVHVHLGGDTPTVVTIPTVPDPRLVVDPRT